MPSVTMASVGVGHGGHSGNPITLLSNPDPRPHPAPITESAASQSDSLMVGHNILVGLFYASPAAGALFLLVAAFVVSKI